MRTKKRPPTHDQKPDTGAGAVSKGKDPKRFDLRRPRGVKDVTR